MTKFSGNAQELDPYMNFKFRIKWDGRYVAGFNKVSALKQTSEVVKHRIDGDYNSSNKLPERMKSETITLERGIATDYEFVKWVNKVCNLGSRLGGEVSLKDIRNNIIIDIYNEAGQLVVSYNVFRCWVSELQAIPDLDTSANTMAIVALKLENEGWKRDYKGSELS